MALPSRRTVFVALGIVLVTVPLWAPALDVTGRDYEYRAAPVTVEDDRISVPGDHPRLSGVDGVDCFAEVPPSRRCAFEASLVDGGPIRADHPTVRSVSGDPPLDAPDPYVAFEGDGRVFERTADWNVSAGAYVLDLRRANASRALADAARPADRYDRPVRRAVATGSARADDPLPEARLVASGDRYYAVYTARSRTFLTAEPFTERVFAAVAVLAGAVAFRRAWAGG